MNTINIINISNNFQVRNHFLHPYKPPKNLIKIFIFLQISKQPTPIPTLPDCNSKSRLPKFKTFIK